MWRSGGVWRWGRIGGREGMDVLFEYCAQSVDIDVVGDFVNYEGEYSAAVSRGIAREVLAVAPRAMSLCDARNWRVTSSREDAARQSHACDALSNWMALKPRAVGDETRALFVLAAWAAGVERVFTIELVLSGFALKLEAEQSMAAYVMEQTCDNQNVSQCCCPLIRACATVCDHDACSARSLAHTIEVLADHGIMIRAASDANIDSGQRMCAIARRWGIRVFDV